MSKEFLLETMKKIQTEDYAWTLYFFKTDFRSKSNPYYLYEHTFHNTDYLPDYIDELVSTMIQYQIEPLESVQNYDGENSKMSCDKISVENELIVEQWGNLILSVYGAPREQIKGKYQGYILDGQPVDDENLPAVTIVKVCNPIISLERKNTKVFRRNSSCDLDDITDEICRLYLMADFVVINNIMYTFNNAFERIFNLEKTMHRMKVNAIDTILSSGAFNDVETVKKLMNSYTSPRTFLTLKQERIEKLSNPIWQSEFSEKLKFEMVEDRIKIETQGQANQLIKYLCYKIFQDKETDNLIEVNSVINDTLI